MNSLLTAGLAAELVLLASTALAAPGTLPTGGTTVNATLTGTTTMIGTATIPVGSTLVVAGTLMIPGALSPSSISTTGAITGTGGEALSGGLSVDTIGAVGTTINVPGSLLDQGDYPIDSSKGSVVTLPAGTTRAIFLVGAAATIAVTMQALPKNGQNLRIICEQAETLTFSGNSGYGIHGATTGCTSNIGHEFTVYSGSTSWEKLY